MLKTNLGRLVAALTTVGALQAVQVAPANADPTPSECVIYSIHVCGGAPNGGPWEELGYSSLQDCRLTEYANCMAGVPPYDPIAFKPGTPNTTVPAKNMTLKRTQPVT